MKNWDTLDGAVLPAKPRRDFVRWRALTATFVTLVVLAGVDTIFPRLKYWSPSDWRNKPAAKPFQWSDVSSKSFHQSSTTPQHASPWCSKNLHASLAPSQIVGSKVNAAVSIALEYYLSIILEIDMFILVACLVSVIQSSTIFYRLFI